MRLRALAGSYAGQVREYSFEAGRAALQTGMAARVDEAVPRRPAVRAVPQPTPSTSSSPWKRRNR